MAINTPQELMSLKLRQIEDAETQASSAIEQLRSQVKNPDLQQLLERRMQEGQEVLEGVRESLSRFDGQASGETQSRAARGIIEEGRSFINEVSEPQLKEAMAIGAIQSLEHYCIATWGTVKALAEEMGEQEVVEVMQRALDSGKELDQQLTDLAESRVNPQAMQGGQSGQRGMQ